jgi:hypothetical protein
MKYINRIGTRAECSPAIGGVILLITLSFLIYHFRHPIIIALVITALCLLSGMVIYTAVAVTVAYRRHVRSVAIQGPQVSAPAPVAPAVQPLPADPDRLPERQSVPASEFADLEQATGVMADGTIV